MRWYSGYLEMAVRNAHRLYNLYQFPYPGHTGRIKK